MLNRRVILLRYLACRLLYQQSFYSADYALAYEIDAHYERSSSTNPFRVRGSHYCLYLEDVSRPKGTWLNVKRSYRTRLLLK